MSLSRIVGYEALVRAPACPFTLGSSERIDPLSSRVLLAIVEDDSCIHVISGAGRPNKIR
jgi:hypothetical protein